MLHQRSAPSGATATLSAPALPRTIGERLDLLPIVPTHRKLTAVIGVGLLFDTFENNLSGTISKVLQTDFALNGTNLKLVLASAFVGQFFGSMLLGRFADRFGRRPAFMINLAIYSLFSLAGAFSPNAAWLIVTRFFAGLGIGAEQALSDCYLSDVLPASKRGRFIAWAYTLAFCGVPAVGFAALWLVPLTPLGVDGWRWLFIMGSLGSAVVWVLRRGLIESPRWLDSAGRRAQADTLVAQLEAEARRGPAAAGPATAVSHGSTLADIGVASPGAGISSGGGVGPRTAQTEAPAPRMRDLFNRRFRRRTGMLWVFATLSVVGYYGFGTLAPQILATKGYGLVTGLGFTALSFLGYPVGSLLSVPIMDRVERKMLLAASAIAMALAGFGFAYANSATLIVAFGFGYTLLSNIFSAVSHVYLAEQYPTAIRAAASGLAYSLSKLSAGALPFVLLPVLENSGPGWMFSLIGVAMVLLALNVVAFGDRTTGTTLDAR